MDNLTTPGWWATYRKWSSHLDTLSEPDRDGDKWVELRNAEMAIRKSLEDFESKKKAGEHKDLSEGFNRHLDETENAMRFYMGKAGRLKQQIELFRKDRERQKEIIRLKEIREEETYASFKFHQRRAEQLEDALRKILESYSYSGEAPPEWIESVNNAQLLLNGKV